MRIAPIIELDNDDLRLVDIHLYVDYHRHIRRSLLFILSQSTILRFEG